MGKKKPKIQREVYHVEVITQARVSYETKNWEYLVKWAGYSSDADSWEPEENVKECARLLASFWKHIGEDDKDYPLGYHVEAQPEWIISERQYFAREYAQQQIEVNRINDEKKAKGKKASKGEQIQSSTTSSSSKTKGKKLVRSVISISDSDSEPLAIRPKKRLAPSSDDESTKHSKKKHRMDLAMNSTALTSDKGKQTEKAPDSPTSLFSEPSSPKVTLTLPSTIPAQSGGGSSKPASALHAPNHQERQIHRGVKLLPLEPQQVASGSGLSTKQRLAQSTTITTSTKPPKIAPARHNLMSLSFKKKPPPVDSPMDKVDKAKPPVMQEESSPVEGRFFSADGPEVAASPKSMTSQDYIPLMEHDIFEPFLPAPGADMRGPPSDTPNALSEVDQFLQSVMPPDLAAPLQPTIEKIPDPIPPRALPKPSLPKIQKKWKWTGKLLVMKTSQEMKRLCDVVMSDATEHLAEGLRLSVVFPASVDSIQLSNLHSVSDLDVTLRACKPIHQLAKLGPQDDKDAAELKILVRYMDKTNQVAFVPVTLDKAIVGILLLFPATMDDLCRRFKVPVHLQENGFFVSALFPWELSVAKRQEESRKPYYADNVTITTSDSDRKSLKTLPKYHIAEHMLGFPRWLTDYMSQPHRPYCVWWMPADGPPRAPGIETEMLLAYLKQCGAKDVGHKADVRAVFVHVGALKFLYKLPALAERRSKRPEIQFYTYGTHANVSRDRWGIHAIFPMGGIVTFTPSALVEDPIGVRQLIIRLVKHPRWECYMVPSTIGMAAKLIHEDEDPLNVFDSGGFFYDNLLTMVLQGDISLFPLPPTTPIHDEDLWIEHQFRQYSTDRRGLLEECMREFNERFSNIPQPEWSSAAETGICSDMLDMQCQPVLMDEYRRFVVIKATTDNHISWDKSGLEWLPLSRFDFKDDYFQCSKRRDSSI